MKKKKSEEEYLPEAAEEETVPEEAKPEAEPEPEKAAEEKKSAVGNYEWDCADKRFNLGEKVFRSGDRLTAVPADADGSPQNPALKKAYKLNYLKKKE